MIYVYTDGSCMHNGKPNAIAGIGIYFGDDDPRNVSRRVVGKQSNNTGELGALIEAHEILSEEIARGELVTVCTDSTYALRCVGEYGDKCAASGWTKDIPNKDMVRRAHAMYKATPNVEVHKVRAHTGGKDPHSVGNDHADRLANEAIRLYLDVPYAEKEYAKEHGAKWDPKKKKWWVDAVTPPLERFVVTRSSQETEETESSASTEVDSS
jgi:ribonuclease HI